MLIKKKVYESYSMIEKLNFFLEFREFFRSKSSLNARKNKTPINLSRLKPAKANQMSHNLKSHIESK